MLDAPHLVITESYIGRDRRRTGPAAAIARRTFRLRRAILRLDVAVVVMVAVVLAGAVGAGLTGAGRTGRPVVRPAPAVEVAAPVTPAALPAAPARALEARRAAQAASAARAASAAAAQAAAAQAAAAQAASVEAAGDPQTMGAAALALVRYPWQTLPGFHIEFRSIAEAPSAGFYGNTVFTWGQAGGTSTLYVYPGETVAQLAGITAFEIGHEVDASLVEPRGGHDAVAGALGIHPSTWAPACDCAEQDYLSGWYAAAFSARWSPGVGSWSRLAPLPAGAVAAAVDPWLDVRP